MGVCWGVERFPVLGVTWECWDVERVPCLGVTWEWLDVVWGFLLWRMKGCMRVVYQRSVLIELWVVPFCGVWEWLVRVVGVKVGVLVIELGWLVPVWSVVVVE